MIVVNRHLLCLYTVVPVKTLSVTAYTIGNANPFIGRSNTCNFLTIHCFHRIETRRLDTPSAVGAKVRVTSPCIQRFTISTHNLCPSSIWGGELPGLARHLHLEDFLRKKVRHSSFFTQNMHKVKLSSGKRTLDLLEKD